MMALFSYQHLDNASVTLMAFIDAEIDGSSICEQECSIVRAVQMSIKCCDSQLPVTTELQERNLLTEQECS